MTRFLWCSAVALMGLAERAWACPGCKEALVDPAELPQRLAAAKGYAASIGLMLVVPLSLVGGLTAVIVRSSRRQRGDRPRG